MSNTVNYRQARICGNCKFSEFDYGHRRRVCRFAITSWVDDDHICTAHKWEEEQRNNMDILEHQEKPCLFCGERNACLLGTRHINLSFSRWSIWCPNCQASGPIKDTEDEAWAAWNYPKEIESPSQEGKQ